MAVGETFKEHAQLRYTVLRPSSDARMAWLRMADDADQ